MKNDEYLGVCRVCFEPVKEGSEITIREGGWPFHSKCVEANPNSYYLALERIRGKFEQGANATELMNDMEGIFKIPALNDERLYIPTKKRHLHGHLEPVSRRVRATLTETEPIYNIE